MQPIVKFDTVLENSLVKSAIYVNGQLLEAITHTAESEMLRARAVLLSSALGVSLQHYQFGVEVTEAAAVNAVIENKSVVPVKHWDAYGVEGTGLTHQFDVIDSREQSGQLFAGVSNPADVADGMIAVTLEVNTSPQNGFEPQPCVHVHFNDDELACSLFKTGKNILLRTENNVSLTSIVVEVGGRPETFYLLEPSYPTGV